MVTCTNCYCSDFVIYQVVALHVLCFLVSSLRNFQQEIHETINLEKMLNSCKLLRYVDLGMDVGCRSVLSDRFLSLLSDDIKIRLDLVLFKHSLLSLNNELILQTIPQLYMYPCALISPLLVSYSSNVPVFFCITGGLT